MPIKTRDGWKTMQQIKRQEKAWMKARQTFVNNIGMGNLEDMAKMESRAREMFKEMDTDANGAIDPAELKAAFSKMGCRLSSSEVSRMMEEADEDGDMLIDVDEFIELCAVEVNRFKACQAAQSQTQMCTVQ